MSRARPRRWDFNSRFLIGAQDNPMMERWRLVQTPWGGLYVHRIYREDLDPVPHDHPWTFWRLVIRGGYVERYFTDPARGTYVLRAQRRWRLGKVPTHHAHRITVVQPGTVSLVVVGPKRRVWGFWGPTEDASPRTWVDYRDALTLRPTEGSRSQHPGSMLPSGPDPESLLPVPPGAMRCSVSGCSTWIDAGYPASTAQAIRAHEREAHGQ